MSEAPPPEDGARRTIVYLGAFHFPDRNAAAQRARANAKLLLAAGFEVILVGHGEGGEAPGKTTMVDGIPCIILPAPRGVLSWARYTLGRRDVLALLEERASSLYGVVCYNFPAIAMLRIRALARRAGFRMLADVTEWYDASGGPLLFRAVKALDTALRMRVVHRLMDGLFTTSPVMTSYYRSSGVPIVELPTLFSANAFASPIMDVGATPGFVYAGSPFADGRVNRGRTNVKDRLDLCVTAVSAALVRGLELRFDIFGVTEEQYLRVYPEHQALLKVAGQAIRFHGAVPNALVRTAVAGASFTVFFRDATRTVLAGFPTKLAESITAGTPVITNDLPNVRPLAGSSGIWLVPRGGEEEAILRAAKMSGIERVALKQECFASRRFDTASFEGPVREFVRALERRRPA